MSIKSASRALQQLWWGVGEEGYAVARPGLMLPELPGSMWPEAVRWCVKMAVANIVKTLFLRGIPFPTVCKRRKQKSLTFLWKETLKVLKTHFLKVWLLILIEPVSRRTVKYQVCSVFFTLLSQGLTSPLPVFSRCVIEGYDFRNSARIVQCHEYTWKEWESRTDWEPPAPLPSHSVRYGTGNWLGSWLALSQTVNHSKSELLTPSGGLK